MVKSLSTEGEVTRFFMEDGKFCYMSKGDRRNRQIYMGKED